MNIEINNIKEIQNPFNHEELSEDFARYLTNKCKLNFNNSLKIKITGNFKQEEQKEIVKIIHQHFNNFYLKWTGMDKYDNFFRLLLLALGIILILISEQLLSVFRELFLIAGWVVIWEIVYDELFSQIKRKHEKNIYKILSTCEIEFINMEKRGKNDK